MSSARLPTFYATFGRAGETDDHLDDVRAGKLSDLGRRVVEYLQHRGETQKKRMRADLGIESKEGRNDLERAIEELQRLMYVARVKAAERLGSSEAAAVLLRRLLDLAGGVTPKQVQRLFDWDSDRVTKAIDLLAKKRHLVVMDGTVVLRELAR